MTRSSTGDSEPGTELSVFQSRELQSVLLSYARAVLIALVKGQSLPAHPELGPEISLLRPGLFVTLKTAKGLRGCIGHIRGHAEILAAIRELCYSSAFEDPRFSPVQVEELSRITLELSLLTQAIPIRDWREIELGRHGILLSNRGHQAVFLPQVADEQGWDLSSTLNALASKAGLAQEAWRESSCHFEIFEAVHFGEP